MVLLNRLQGLWLLSLIRNDLTYDSNMGGLLIIGLWKMGLKDMGKLIACCRKQDRKCQKLLYKSHYGLAMGICLRYASNRNEATEIMNKGFFKAFLKLQKYNFQESFKAWFRRILINTSIDYYRNNLTGLIPDDIESAGVTYNDLLTESNLGHKELIAMVQQLPLGTRLVFNLHAVDGYTHKEIGEILGKSEGISGFYLSKAREILRKMIEEAG
jgi:RNA polymerase sigma factor (sigma-70 family)